MNSASRRRGTLFGMAFVAFCGMPSASLAQAQAEHSAGDIAHARELFKEAMAARAAGDTRGALEKFRAAHALGGTPVTGLELGRTQMNLGSLVEARESFLSVARIPVSPQETAHSSAARQEAAQLAASLRARIPTVLFRVTGAQAALASVTVDGVIVPTIALGAPRPLDPGTHSFRATSPGGHAGVDLSLGEGETPTVDLVLAADAPAVAIAPPAAGAVGLSSDGSSYPLKPLLFTGIAVAGAGVIVGAVSGGLALSKASSVNKACPAMVCRTNESSSIQSGETLGTVSTIGFVVAGAGAAAAVFALLYPHGSHDTSSATAISPWVSGTAAGVRGTF